MSFQHCLDCLIDVMYMDANYNNVSKLLCTCTSLLLHILYNYVHESVLYDV